MNAADLFAFYRQHHASPIPKDRKFLEGMYLIRRTHVDGSIVAGEIIKSAPSLQRFEARILTGENTNKNEWIAYAALEHDVVLLHSNGDMWSCYTALAKNYAAEQAEKVAA